MPTHWVLWAREYCDQFFVSRSRASRSSPMHASLSRPILIELRVAPSQLGPTFNVGGPSATASPTCDPSDRETTAILVTKAIMVILVCGCCPSWLCRWRSISDDGWRKWRTLGGLVRITGGLAPSGLPKRFGTSFRNCRIGLFAAGHCCPSAFLDERLEIPSEADFLQLGEICGCVRRLAELVDADRCKSSKHCCVGPLFCDPFNRASERPSAPAEADDHRHDSAGGCALQETFERVSVQY